MRRTLLSIAIAGGIILAGCSSPTMKQEIDDNITVATRLDGSTVRDAEGCAFNVTRDSATAVRLRYNAELSAATCHFGEGTTQQVPTPGIVIH